MILDQKEMQELSEITKRFRLNSSQLQIILKEYLNYRSFSKVRSKENYLGFSKARNEALSYILNIIASFWISNFDLALSPEESFWFQENRLRMRAGSIRRKEK